MLKGYTAIYHKILQSAVQAIECFHVILGFNGVMF